MSVSAPLILSTTFDLPPLTRKKSTEKPGGREYREPMRKANPIWRGGGGQFIRIRKYLPTFSSSASVLRLHLEKLLPRESAFARLLRPRAKDGRLRLFECSERGRDPDLDRGCDDGPSSLASVRLAVETRGSRDFRFLEFEQGRVVRWHEVSTARFDLRFPRHASLPSGAAGTELLRGEASR